jgi:ABC-2 type transport system permease protein
MNPLGVCTLLRKEVLRFASVWLQTVVAPVITALLYLLVFAQVLKGRLEVYPGVAYSAFLLPGLIMMSVIQNAFANSSSSLIQSKMAGNIVFMLLAPLSHLELLAAFVAASIVRAVVVGAGVWLVAVPFVPLPLHSLAAIIAFAVLGGATLGAIGVMAGIWARKFDQLAGFQNFLILPLSFLSGVFYSIHALPPFWASLSHLNPFFYLIDGFRYGFLGVSDVDPWLSLLAAVISAVTTGGMAWAMLKSGYRLRD